MTPLIAAKNIVVTGHIRYAEFEWHKFKGLQTTVGGRYEPQGQELERKLMDDDILDWHGEFNARSMGSAEVQRSPYYPLAVALAAPFVYLIDPALTVASTPALGLFLGGEAAYWWYWRRKYATPQPPEPSPQP